MNTANSPAPAPAPAPARAGEGGGLPKGLSLFRFILFSALMAGALYGGASLYFNAPPPPGIASADWAPNPLWLPAYLALKLHVGSAFSTLGYVFTGPLGRALYAMTSIALGIVIFGVLGWFSAEAIRKWAVRKRYE